ncbi:unnamed protein product [Dracunculus medinensis]|uniref:G_PROTEIN_RECEP_F1_2 domain-containing protein n=1 Tax=Dracunculus medinensis TaxID=318479 RepID=A0A0N4URR1_DRAME|nr:unnamed protein product [Dracunculus medinensis]
MCESYEILSDSAIEFEQASIKWKYISGCLGIIGTIINIFQLIILISWQGYKKFPEYVFLAVADFCTTLGIAGRSLFQINLSSSIAEIGMVCMQTTVSCARNSDLWFRLAGSVLATLILVIIGLQKVSCAFWPFWYKRQSEYK